MRSSTIVRLAWVSWWLTLLFEAGMVGFGAANGSHDPSRVLAAVTAVLAFQSMATIGVLIVRRDPLNAVGWVFCASSLLMMAGNV